MKKAAHKFRDLSPEQKEEHFSNYLMDSWSYSKVGSFARNEKSFEMVYIYRIKSKQGSSSIAGSAYHHAIEYYFMSIMDEKKVRPDLIDLQTLAFNFIEEVPLAEWKLQKSTPTIDKCISVSNNTVNVLLENFLMEIAVYTEFLDEILDIEAYYDEFVTLNGVPIPLPCHAKIDLVIKTKKTKKEKSKTVIIDHKSKRSFTDEEEAKLSIGRQAMVYVLCYEEKTGKKVDEVWFVENKASKNKNGDQQLKPFKVEIDKDTRKLYEAMLYEPLKRMIEAVSNPDYIYLMNENDSFVDKPELYAFWMSTMIGEIDDMHVKEDKKELIALRTKKTKDSSLAHIDTKTIKKFRAHASEFIQYDYSNKDMDNKEKIKHVLQSHNVRVTIEHVFEGYSSNTYLMLLGAGNKYKDVKKYKLDIAQALNVSNVRIGENLYVYKGKSFLAVESSKKREKDLLFDPSLLEGMKIPIGINNFGKLIVWDLNNPSTTNVLICGSIGSGKTVEIVSIIEYCKLAGVEETIIFDPKFEFGRFKEDGISVLNDISDIETYMELLVEEMNTRIKNGVSKKTLVVFDEYAMATAQAAKGKDLDVYENVIIGQYQKGPKVGLDIIEKQLIRTRKPLSENLRILLQTGRSSGYHVVAATQRASAQVITGDAKVNFPVMICFKVPKETDSRVVLDEAGAESLAGVGDGLISSPEYEDIERFQGFYYNK